MSQSGAQSASPFVEASSSAPGYDLADVEVVLFSPVQNTRRVIRDAVHGAGFRRVNVGNSVEKLRRSVRESEFDMLVLEAKEHVDEVCEHIRDIRHGRLGKNPYLVITVITWNPNDVVIREFVDESIQRKFHPTGADPRFCDSAGHRSDAIGSTAPLQRGGR